MAKWAGGLKGHSRFKTVAEGHNISMMLRLLGDVLDIR